MTPVKLHTEFDFPFATRVALVPARQPLQVTVRLGTATPAEEAFRRVDAHVHVWMAAAMYGMGAGPAYGPRIRSGPLDSTKVVRVLDRTPTDESVRFAADDLSCDPAYAVVLLHKLFCLSRFYDPIATVSIDIPADVEVAVPLDVARGARSDLPSLVPPPFPYDIDTSTSAESYEVDVRWGRSLDGAHPPILRGLLANWIAQAMQGGYIGSGFTPDNFALIASEEATIATNGLAWSLDQVAVDDRVFVALLHGLSAFSAGFTPVAQASIL